MNIQKKKRLEAAGWRVGSAEDFLGLSDEEVAYIDLKMTLSQNLRQRREKAQWTQIELAKRLKSSQSRVAKIESGDPSVSLDLLIRSLFTLGVTKSDLSKMLVSEL
jgi:DNA-binding XRE family transcriptional regulator